MHRAMVKTTGRYSPARRFEEVRSLLNSTGGATVYEIAERLHVSVRTAIRYLRAMEDAGERIYDEREGYKKIWRLMPSAREGLLRMTSSQMISLFLSRRVFDFLEGTGFKEDLDEIFQQLETTLKRQDFIAAKNLDKKLYSVNEAPYRYEGKIEDVNDIVTALLREERLAVRHGSVGRGRKKFEIDPYTLLVYKKGLYLAGYSHHHEAVRTFAFDGFRAIEWLRKSPFEYPDDWEPSSLVAGSFGIFASGEPTKVRIRFDPKVERFVRRRQWHPSQKLKTTKQGLEMTMKVHGTVEVVSWVLSFGDKAELLEPADLREMVAKELRAAAAIYG